MKRLSLLIAFVLLAVAVTTIQAQNAGQLQQLFASAQHKETSQGDLKGALETYKQVVAQAGSNRSLAAQALLRMAECYQKLGDAQARAVWEQIVRGYQDQKSAVAAAQARLGISASARVGSQQAVWTGPYVDIYGRVSPDGKLISFVDWGRSNNLSVHDTLANT